MESIDLIRHNLRMSRELVLKRVEEMRDHCFVYPTPQGGGHTLWVLGHLSYIEGLVVRQFMLGEANPFAEDLASSPNSSRAEPVGERIRLLQPRGIQRTGPCQLPNPLPRR